MEYKVNGETFVFKIGIEEEKAFSSFDKLAQKTFGLSFAHWREAGYWTDKYCPYTLLKEETVVANVSVNHINAVLDGVPKRFIQLGTVMTDPEYRGLGLSRFLMEQVLEDCVADCDMLYLYANNSVVNFYPKFGFEKAEEYHAYALPIDGERLAEMQSLNMEQEKDRAVLYAKYQEGNPFASFLINDNWELLMFYCISSMQNCVYYIKSLDAVVVAEQEGGVLTVFDIYGSSALNLKALLKKITAPGCTEIRFGFALKETQKAQLLPLQAEDTTLFVLKGKENIFEKNKTMLPLLTHA
ncbi:MAG: GNAT family N-acetyltransferase [Oscillospiraceae bacterium]